MEKFNRNIFKEVLNWFRKNFWIIIGTGILVAAIPTIFYLLDITNYGTKHDLSSTYDWLGFFGSYVGSILGAFVLIFVTNRDRKISDDTNRVTTCYSVIEFEEYVQYIKEINPNKDKILDKILYEENIGESSKCMKILFRISDRNKMPLNSVNISRIAIRMKKSNETIIYEHFAKNDGYDRIISSKEDGNYFFAGHFITSHADEILQANEFSIVINLAIKNIFGVTIKGECTIVIAQMEESEFTSKGKFENLQIEEYKKYKVNNHYNYWEKIYYDNKSLLDNDNGKGNDL